jgi:hypothetical protein
MLVDDASLLENSAEKCDMCQLVLIALRTSPSPKDPDPNNLPSLCEQLQLESGAAPASVYLTLKGAALAIRIKGGGYRGFSPSLKSHAQLRKAYVTASNTLVLMYCLIVGSPAAAAGIPAGLSINGEPNTEGHFFLFREWVRHCVEEHEQCSRPLTSPKLPTRVLDVEGGTSSPENLRLFHTGQVSGRYIALSHRWGEYTPLKTTKTLIGIHSEEILLADLPRTFRDAVMVTRKLGIRYLWIDCLCIVQDDPQDWLREAALMGEIFANSYCTLAATSAKDSNGGLFLPRTISQSVKLTDWSGDSPVSYYAGIEDRFESALRDGDLNNRGWVLQERLLSPRTIHFTASQTFWECGSDRYSEDCVENSFT